MHICAGIEYDSPKGLVHSDLCFESEDLTNGVTRKELHTALDEWLDKSEGSGRFFVGKRPKSRKP